MSTHSWETEIDLPIEKVWNLLSDQYADIYKMHPGVKISTQVEGAPASGVGQERICEFYDGNRAHERITALEEGRLLALDLIDGTLPVEKFSAAFNLSKLAEDRTAVRMDVDVIGKGFMKILSPLIARKSEQLISKVLKGIEAHGQTGQVVGKGGELEGQE